jgi:hypothetical protein
VAWDLVQHRDKSSFTLSGSVAEFYGHGGEI